MGETRIYWLIDTRPETMRQWSRGLPFYCGMTERDDNALYKHLLVAVHDASSRLKECGVNWRIHVVQVIPFAIDSDPYPARQYWIDTLRRSFPGSCLNKRRETSSASQNRNKLAQDISKMRKCFTRRRMIGGLPPPPY